MSVRAAEFCSSSTMQKYEDKEVVGSYELSGWNTQIDTRNNARLYRSRVLSYADEFQCVFRADYYQQLDFFMRPPANHRRGGGKTDHKYTSFVRKALVAVGTRYDWCYDATCSSSRTVPASGAVRFGRRDFQETFNFFDKKQNYRQTGWSKLFRLHCHYRRNASVRLLFRPRQQMTVKKGTIKRESAEVAAKEFEARQRIRRFVRRLHDLDERLPTTVMRIIVRWTLLPARRRLDFGSGVMKMMRISSDYSFESGVMRRQTGAWRTVKNPELYQPLAARRDTYGRWEDYSSRWKTQDSRQPSTVGKTKARPRTFPFPLKRVIQEGQKGDLHGYRQIGWRQFVCLQGTFHRGCAAGYHEHPCSLSDIWKRARWASNIRVIQKAYRH